MVNMFYRWHLCFLNPPSLPPSSWKHRNKVGTCFIFPGEKRGKKPYKEYGCQLWSFPADHRCGPSHNLVLWNLQDREIMPWESDSGFWIILSKFYLSALYVTGVIQSQSPFIDHVWALIRNAILLDGHHNLHLRSRKLRFCMLILKQQFWILHLLSLKPQPSWLPPRTTLPPHGDWGITDSMVTHRAGAVANPLILLHYHPCPVSVLRGTEAGKVPMPGNRSSIALEEEHSRDRHRRKTTCPTKAWRGKL